VDGIKGGKILRERFAERRAERPVEAEADESPADPSPGDSEFVARIGAWTRAAIAAAERT
jgi:hypothetical protein